MSNLIDLSPKYVQFELPDGSKINDSQNGMVLEQLGIKNGDIITARKIAVQEDIIDDPLVDKEKDRLTPKAYQIFNEWFDMYMDQEKGVMTAEST